MLDGILYRGFSVKCKALTKATRARIGVVRRRADAQQRFLKDDLAKLLSNGLDINAYGRTEEFIAGKDLLSCYDFIEYSCEYTKKLLSRMQKQGDCPEECREAVASLMYAAARFSDLPELRELRDIFQQKYGTSLEFSVNRKFVEKLSSSPPTSEKRLQVLQDIASEFSIKWDYRGFERRMATSAVAQADADKGKARPGILEKRRVCDFREDNICFPGGKRDGGCLQGDGKIILEDVPTGYIGESKEALFCNKADSDVNKSKPCSSYGLPPPPYVKSKENNTPRPPKEDGGVKVKNDDHQLGLITRKHHTPSSSSCYNNVVGTGSREKDHSGKGLQMELFEEQHKKKDDEEERMIDKLLIHYCKKPSDVGESSLDQKKPAAAGLKHSSRSVSLPPQPKKIFTRANSFHPDDNNSQAHTHYVHPKLPDYDDLAARFATLKAT